MTEFDDVFDEIRKQLTQTKTEATPVFDRVATHMTPLVKTSERIGGLKTLIALQGKLEILIRQTNAKPTAKQIIDAIDEVRIELMGNNQNG